LIAIEGIDGSGKSTQTALLAERLGALATFEPGATALGAEVRALLLERERAVPVPRAEALLVLADRAQHLSEVIVPAMGAGRWVVTDRFTASTIAYQGAGRGLDATQLAQVARWATDDVRADLTVLLDVEVETAMARLVPTPADRLEASGAAFFARVRRGFLDAAAADPSRWVVVRGDGAPDGVADAVFGAVAARLGTP